MNAGPAGIGMWLRRTILYAALFAALIGVFARFERLDFKIFWPDETFSMLRITGHTEEDLLARIDGRPHTVADLRTLDRLDPERGFGATMLSMREEPQRGPLFYMAARIWASAFGDGVVPMRALGAIFGTAGIALAYFLGRRLTETVLGGAMAAALVAVAPIMLHLSRQVREYVSLADATLAAGLLLLICIERAVPVRWAAYAAVSIAGFFISPIFVSVWGAHGLALLMSRQPKRTLVGWLIAIAASAAICLPWLVDSLRTAPAHTRDLAWLAEPYDRKALLLKWVFNVGAVFFDSEIVHHAFVLVLIPVMCFVATAVVMAARNVRNVRFSLPVATVVCGFAPSLALDAAKHTHFEAVTRYQMVAWVGVEMLVVVAIANSLASVDARRSGVAAIAFLFLATTGLVSWALDRPYDVWWDNNGHVDDRAVAAAISSRGPRALILSSQAAFLFTLARYLPDDSHIELFDLHHPLPDAPPHAFLFEPEASVLAAYRRRLGSTGAIADVSPSRSLNIPQLSEAPAGGKTEDEQGARPLWQIGARVQLPVP